MNPRICAALLIMSAAACDRSDDAANSTNAATPPAEVAPAPAPEAPARPTPPEAPVDRTSPAAARNLVASYAAAVVAGRPADGRSAWSTPDAARQFETSLEGYPEVAIAVGQPVDEEGAAGSIFITVPMTMNLTLRSGAPFAMTCKALVRRVNDVPGATQRQLDWQIQSIDC